MRIYALRHRDTGKYLQDAKSGRSFNDFTTMTKPRLFHNKRAAAAALRAWRQGPAEYDSGVIIFRFGAPYNPERVFVPVEIVEFECTEIQG